MATALRRALENGAPVSLRLARKTFNTKMASNEALVFSADKDWAKSFQLLQDLNRAGLPFCALLSSPEMLEETISEIESPSRRLNGKDQTRLQKTEAHKKNEPCLDELIEKKLSHFVSKISQSDGKNLYDLLIQEVEKPLIKFALKATDGNQVQASQLLGMHRNTLRKKMKDLKIASGKKTSR